MNLEDTTFVTYKRKRVKYIEDPDLEKINLEDTESEDMIDSQEDKGKGTAKEENRMAFHSLISALNDFSKGQKEALSAIKRLADKLGQDQRKLQVAHGDEGSTNNNGIHGQTNI